MSVSVETSFKCLASCKIPGSLLNLSSERSPSFDKWPEKSSAQEAFLLHFASRQRDDLGPRPTKTWLRLCMAQQATGEGAEAIFGAAQRQSPRLPRITKGVPFVVAFRLGSCAAHTFRSMRLRNWGDDHTHQEGKADLSDTPSEP